jgi:hypothetical protein
LFVSKEPNELAARKEPQFGTTYGVIVAQRRANGHVWAIVAGLHGAGTVAAAEALKLARIDLSPPPDGRDGPVHVRVIKAEVTVQRWNGITKSDVTKVRVLDEFRDTALRPAG